MKQQQQSLKKIHVLVYSYMKKKWCLWAAGKKTKNKTQIQWRSYVMISAIVLLFLFFSTVLKTTKKISIWDFINYGLKIYSAIELPEQDELSFILT